MKNQQYNKNSHGFSLIEMAVVIAIMGILMTFGIRLASSFQNKGAFSATAERQKQIKDVLTAYLARNGELPCPADPGVLTGVENPIGGVCLNNPGLVPFQTLGIPRSSALDGWDRYFTYVVWNINDPSNAACTDANYPLVAVTSDWTSIVNHPASPLGTYHDGTNGCLMIEEADAAGNITNRRRAVALLISHGPNGFGGYTAKGEQMASDGTVVAEDNNSIGTGVITTAFRTQPINLDGFDDVVMEISADDLLVPLKRDGTVVSKQQLDRDYLYTLFYVVEESSAPPGPPVLECKIYYYDLAGLVTVVPSTALPAPLATLTHPDHGSIAIPASKYCPTGQIAQINSL